MFTKKNILLSGLFIILLAGIPVGMYLIKNPQILKSRAANPYIKLLSADGKPLEIISFQPGTKTPIVKAQVIAPRSDDGKGLELRAYQTLIGAGGKILFYRDCKLDPNVGPWGLGGGFDPGDPCLWQGGPGNTGYDLNTAYHSERYNHNIQVTNITIYKNPDGWHAYQTLIGDSGKRFWYRDCLFNPQTEGPWGLGDGFYDNNDPSSVRCAWKGGGPGDPGYDLNTSDNSDKYNHQLEENNTIIYYRGQEKRGFQILLADGGKLEFWRDCHMEPSEGPWQLGDGFGVGTTCPWIGPINLTTEPHFGGGLVVNNFAYYKRGEESRVVENIVGAGGKRSWFRDCVFRPEAGETPWSIGDGFGESARCPWRGGDNQQGYDLNTALSSEKYGHEIQENSIGVYQRDSNTNLAVSFRVGETGKLDSLAFQTYSENAEAIINLENPQQGGVRFISAQFQYSDGSTKTVGPVQLNYAPPQAGSNQQPLYNIPVLVLKYFPTKDGVNIDGSVTGDVGGTVKAAEDKTTSMTENLKNAITKSTQYLGYKDPNVQPSIGISIIDTKTYNQAVPIKPNGVFVTYPDYQKVMQDNNICDYVDNKGVREVWLWAYQGPPNPNKSGQSYLGISESKMSSKFGDVSNSAVRNDLPLCQHTYRVYSFNYGRGTKEALESWGHQIEFELDNIDHQLYIGYFQGTPYPQTAGVTGRCGSVHNPPNARFEYDRANPNPQDSDCLDWQADKVGQVSPISCALWGCEEFDDGYNAALNYQIWMWQNLPGLNNKKTYKGLPLKNFWEVHANYDEVVGKDKSLILHTPGWSCGRSCREGCEQGFVCTGTGICVPQDRTANRCADSVLPGCRESCKELPCEGGLACDGNSGVCVDPANPNSLTCENRATPGPSLPPGSPSPSPGVKPPKAGIDLDVTFIERTPKYPRYIVNYPTSGHRPEASNGTDKHWPDVGENLTYTVHVINKGTVSASGFNYKWVISGAEQPGNYSGDLNPDQEITFSIQSQFPQANQTIQFKVDPDNSITEISKENNSLSIGTHSWSLSIWVEKEFYKIFNNTYSFANSYSFEDWIQKHFEKINERFTQAIYPSSPSGIAGSVRIDKIVVADDLNALNSPFSLDAEQSLEDGRWHIDDGDSTNNAGKNGVWQNYVDTHINGYDWGLNHELTHQLGIIDLYRMNLPPEPGVNNRVQIKDASGKLVPFTNLYHQEVVFDHPGLMGGGEIAPYTDGSYYESHTAGCLNSTTGHRRGYYGECLYDTPTTTQARVLDSKGKPIANAQVYFYQKDERTEYVYDNVTFSGTTDSNGLITLPNREVQNWDTATGHHLRANPFGDINVVGTNSTMLVRIDKDGQEGYGQFLLHDVNLAYWSGKHDSAIVDLRSNYPKIAVNPTPTPSLSPVELPFKAISVNNQSLDLVSATPVNMKLNGVEGVGKVFNLPFGVDYTNGSSMMSRIEFRYIPLNKVYAVDDQKSLYDLNDDKAINSVDVSILLNSMQNRLEKGDLNQDQVVNSLDYSILRNNLNK